MARALSEAVFSWQAAEWPPRALASAAASDCFDVTGTIRSHYALNVRRAKELSGFMKGAVSADVNLRVRALQLDVTAITRANGATVPPEQYAGLFAKFVAAASGSEEGKTAASGVAHLVPAAASGAGAASASLIFWASDTLEHDLASKADGKAVELTNALVKLTTDGATLVVKSATLVKHAAENTAAAAKLSDQPNLFAQAAGKMNAAALASATTKTAAKKDDDDWDD